MFQFETSHQIATDGENEKIYRLFKDGEHVCDASYSGGPYIDLGTYHDESTEYALNWNRISAEPGTFEARECVNVWNYALGKAEITNSVGQVEAQAFEFLFDTECSECNADTSEAETDLEGRCENCQES